MSSVAILITCHTILLFTSVVLNRIKAQLDFSYGHWPSRKVEMGEVVGYCDRSRGPRCRESDAVWDRSESVKVKELVIFPLTSQNSTIDCSNERVNTK